MQSFYQKIGKNHAILGQMGSLLQGQYGVFRYFLTNPSPGIVCIHFFINNGTLKYCIKSYFDIELNK